MVVHHLAIGLFHFLVQLVHQDIAVILEFLDTVDIQEQMELQAHQDILDTQEPLEQLEQLEHQVILDIQEQMVLMGQVGILDIQAIAVQELADIQVILDQVFLAIAVFLDILVLEVVQAVLIHKFNTTMAVHLLALPISHSMAQQLRWRMMRPFMD